MARELRRDARRAFAPAIKRIRRLCAPDAQALPTDFDEDLVATVEQVRPYTMTSPDRLAGLVGGMQHVLRHEVPGAIVECGVWKGGSMMAAALTLLAHDVTDRDLYLCDTFAGMSEPTSVDIAGEGLGAPNADARTIWATRQRAGRSDWAYAGLEEVRANLLSTGYPPARLHFVKGKVEDTVPRDAPSVIALLRLDTDWYESTRHELTHLYPRLCCGGILIIDDYGHWSGARKATDEYFAPRPPFLHRLDYTGRLVVKS